MLRRLKIWLRKRRRIHRLRRAGRKLNKKGSRRELPRYLKKVL